MPIDPRLGTFLEQTGLMKKPGSAPRRPEVLLAEERESAKQVIVAPSNMLEPVAHIENFVIPGLAGDLPEISTGCWLQICCRYQPALPACSTRDYPCPARFLLADWVRAGRRRRNDAAISGGARRVYRVCNDLGRAG